MSLGFRLVSEAAPQDLPIHNALKFRFQARRDLPWKMCLREWIGADIQQDDKPSQDRPQYGSDGADEEYTKEARGFYDRKALLHQYAVDVCRKAPFLYLLTYFLCEL